MPWFKCCSCSSGDNHDVFLRYRSANAGKILEFSPLGLIRPERSSTDSLDPLAALALPTAFLSFLENSVRRCLFVRATAARLKFEAAHGILTQSSIASDLLETAIESEPHKRRGERDGRELHLAVIDFLIQSIRQSAVAIYGWGWLC